MTSTTAHTPDAGANVQSLDEDEPSHNQGDAQACKAGERDDRR